MSTIFNKLSLASLPQNLYKIVQGWVFSVVLKMLILKQGLKRILPSLEKAPRVSCKNFQRDSDKVDLQACGSYKIIDATDSYQGINAIALNTLHEEGKTSSFSSDHSTATTQEKLESICQKLLETVLPHIVQDIDLDQCYFYTCLEIKNGGYLPVMHTDTDWLMFPKHEGFQLWYLLENDHDQNHGNMFMVKTSALSPTDPPVSMEVRRDGSIEKKIDSTMVGNEKTVVGRWSEQEAKEQNLLQFEYLDMKPGECMIMSKRSLHMSDPRPHLEGIPSNRRAFVLRIILPDKNSKENFLRFNVNHKFTRYSRLHSSLKQVALRGKKLEKGVYQLRLKSHFDMFDPNVSLTDQIRSSNPKPGIIYVFVCAFLSVATAYFIQTQTLNIAEKKE
mmetsp:Transcript_16504/g.22622  ORF Transcript_16504/g.22622 Transcript_16504/m.22622 type:complete len:390 (-) Transcript_16504:220-1389(-)|eukprot:CAMPEP_0185735566 /NCGR_PEP_ID=MMETSP1171-20130828/25644_1 /TAXON_ID=374046 /ORGANISM="Helicotheca tamensis, Strain CCMP826" /LENGTH=389 /DNA_ID=CAMNT_0028405925 /DNA_START=265 /DNA_END=1434 /DNA_ORIENTATION=+